MVLNVLTIKWCKSIIAVASEIAYTRGLRGVHTSRRTPDGEKYPNPHILSDFPPEVIDVKRSLLIAFCLVLCAGMAFAQAGSLGVFADTWGGTAI